jgi:hypothetical protein
VDPGWHSRCVAEYGTGMGKTLNPAPNIIEAVFNGLGVLPGQKVPNDEIKNERVRLIYEVSNGETRRILNMVMTEICGKPLSELVGLEPPKPTDPPVL